ncbi:MAG TPA: SulP family inorganic anion transporter [Dissulfurispiraceae bacterium]|nr:SulP family inorganic anion transporter [Dissulfurispiraceae bacterium]
MPILQGILPIDMSRVSADIIAGITLAALAIPEVMGYTKIAGTPVISGLYTILIPLILFSIFGSSRHLVVGADSATAAILAGSLFGTAVWGSAKWLELASILALLSAGFLILAFILRLGFLADFMSRTVLTGFLAGVGVQVSIWSIPEMLGIPVEGQNTIQQFVAGLHHLLPINAYSAFVSVIVLVIMVASKKMSTRIPGALIAVICSILASVLFDLQAHGVNVTGRMPAGLPSIGLPTLRIDKALLVQLLPTAFAMSVVILTQSAATSRAYAARYNEHFNENVDLFALSLANIGAGLSGTFVVNGSPTKTQMLDSFGGRSQLSQIVTALVVFLVLLFLTGPLSYLPDPALSAVVFIIGIELINVKEMRKISVQSPTEFWVAFIAAIAVITAGVEWGIILSMVLSLIDHVRRSYRPTNVIVAANGTGGWRSLPLSTPKQLRPGLLVYRFTHSIYYANTDRLFQEVMDLVNNAHPHLRWFCIEASAIAGVDYTAAEVLRSIHGILTKKDIRLVFADVVIDTVQTELDRFELTELIGKDFFYTTLQEMVAAYDGISLNDTLRPS